MTKSYFFYFLFLSLALLSCKEDKTTVNLSHIKIDVDIARFDREFDAVTQQTIGELISKYPYLFPGDETDSVWVARKNDSLSKVLFKEVAHIFDDFSKEEEQIKDVFKRVVYHYPTFKAPKVISLVSNLDMENQVIYADTLLLLALDTYLGKDYPFYSNYPKYLRRNFDKNRLPFHIAKEIARETQPKIPNRVFIDRVVAAGKLYYTTHEFLPDYSDMDLLNYTEEELKWAEENEESIWQYFVEKEYLFSTDKELQMRFLDPAPFSKFYLVSDNKTPGRIGEWLGYQIVQSYMDKYVVSLPELMATSPEEIFKNSKYKPKQ